MIQINARGSRRDFLHRGKSRGLMRLLLYPDYRGRMLLD